jgi:hypothetical protein
MIWDAVKAALPDLYLAWGWRATAAFFAVWLLAGVVIWYAMMYRPAMRQASPPIPASPQPGSGTGQQQRVGNSPGSTNIQAGRESS